MTVVPINRSTITATRAALASTDAFGTPALSDAELLAILLEKHDGRPDVTGARRLLRDGLLPLVRTAVDSNALSPIVTRRVRAAVELARRAYAAFPDQAAPAVDIATLGRALAARTAFAVQERMGVVLLDSRERVIGERELFVGTLTGASVSVVPILRAAFTHHAAGFILHHNHPSGALSPSGEDVTFTAQVARAADLVDLAFHDHLVLAAGRSWSFRAHGYLP
jgi:DNA repair protein RadC